MLYMPFAYYYIGPVAFLTYALAGRSLFGRFSNWGLLFFLSFTAYLLLLFVENGIADSFRIVRFFWGFLLFYLVFKSGIQIQIDKLLVFLSVLTILEAVLVNTIISAEYLPNSPLASNMPPGFFEGFANSGLYQRPFSFGGSPSVTSVILVAMLAASKLGWKGKSLAIAAILACMSGSGFVALFIYFLAIVHSSATLLLVPAFIGIVYSEIIEKISFYYISLLVEFKTNQIMSEIPMDSLLMGVPLETRPETGIGGDFAGLSFFALNGFVGLLLLLIFLVANTNKKNWLPLLIMFAGTLHYGVIFFLPGQLMFGYFLNLKSEIISVNDQNKKGY